MLSRWLQCRERFRLYAIEGLRPLDGWNLPIHFGLMWHTAEEFHAKKSAAIRWEIPLREYASQLVDEYPTSAEAIEHWYNIIKIQFPCYVEYWKKHPDMEQRQPLFQELPFDVPYKLPSGRVVRLRGKWDSVDKVKRGVVLQENKTKSKIDQMQLMRQLKFDLQTMIYLVALRHGRFQDIGGFGQINSGPDWMISGVRYNVIRRECPIRQHKPSKSNPKGETREHFYKRLETDYFKANPEEWFFRFNVDVTTQDILRFEETCLKPMLENVCWWYDEVTGKLDPSDYIKVPPMNWVHPYGVRNLINEGFTGEYDHAIETGSRVGLKKMDLLFEELM
jgi:hypothetical protein